jgi:hypothetical protein
MAFGYNIDVRKTNKKNHIIDLFRHNGPLSKVQAKQMSGYSMDTILNVFDSLLEEKSLQKPPEPRNRRVARLRILNSIPTPTFIWVSLSI